MTAKKKLAFPTPAAVTLIGGNAFRPVPWHAVHATCWCRPSSASFSGACAALSKVLGVQPETR